MVAVRSTSLVISMPLFIITHGGVMFTEQPTMNSLFSQLGLGSSDEEIAEFFETHRGLNKSQHLHEAPYWNESQSAFLKDSILEDAAWAEVIDQLNAELHE